MTAIKIVYYTETIDNWGRTESSSKAELIYNILKNSDDFTDDMEFEDDKGRVYDIDSLIGKKVIVEGFDEFIVTE